MKNKEPITLNLNLDWRVLVVLGLGISLFVLAFSVARARAGVLPDANNLPPKTEANQPQRVSQPGASLAQVVNCPDGLIATTNGDCISPDEVGVPPITAAGDVGIAAVGSGARHFYVTAAPFYANTATTVCAVGYHMASLWEMLDVSNLIYDYDTPGAKTWPDSAFGPPSNWYGRVRTGYDQSVLNTPGTGNCQNWSLTSGSAFDTEVRLTNSWVADPGNISTWDAASFPCNAPASVWCAK